MKELFYILILLFCFQSCVEKSEESHDTHQEQKKTEKALKLHKLKKLFVTGDFDGDGKTDTLYQHNFSNLTKSEIEFSLDPMENKWEKVIEWFYKRNPNLYININKEKKDTLHLGKAQSLYCLLNIGDNNKDGKDEIALVIDVLDHSNINSCLIYTLCEENWILLKQFEILESAFDYTTINEPIFTKIDGFLEKQNGKWFYFDYLNEIEGNKRKLIPLVVQKCNNNVL